MGLLRGCLIAGVACVFAGAPAARADDPLDSIARRLASGPFEQREAAQAELEKMPATALEAVLDLLATVQDPEVAVRLRRRAFGMAGERIVQQEKNVPPGVKVTGRVVDVNGAPFANLPVKAFAPALGAELSQALDVTGHSDAAGQFEMTVPFADLLYGLTPARGITGLPPCAVLPAVSTAAPDLQYPVKVNPAVGTLVDQAGRPVIGQALEVFGAPGECWRVTTDAKGEFSIKTLGLAGIGQIPAARVLPGGPAGDGVAWAKGAGYQFQLVKPATLQGMVRDENGTAMPHVRVIAGAIASSTTDMRWTAETDAAGRYTLPVPPAEGRREGYWMIAEAPGYRTCGHATDPDVLFDPLNIYAMAAGAKVEANIDLERPTMVVGRVLDAAGNPVNDALVGVDATGTGDYTLRWHAVRSDTQGRFVITAGRRAAAVVAISAEGGLGRETFEPSREARFVRKDVRLGVAYRARGVVTDAAGKPIKDVACLPNGATHTPLFTGEDGHFDLGQVPAVPGGAATVLFRAPRVQRDYGMWTGPDGVTYDPNTWGAVPTFYFHKEVPLKDSGEMKVVLEPTRLVEFTGMVVDEAGKRVEKAGVELLSGNATANSAWHSRGAAPGVDPAIVTVWGAPYTAADGRFRLLGIVENGVGMQRGNVNTNWKSFSIGVVAGTRETVLPNLPFPETGTRELTLTLPPAPPAPAPPPPARGRPF